MTDIRKSDAQLDAEASAPLEELLADWAADFDEGWGDRFASGDPSEGGFGQLDHGYEHTYKEFRLLRAVRS